MGIMFVSVKEMHENFWAALSREKKKNSIQQQQQQQQQQIFLL